MTKIVVCIPYSVDHWLHFSQKCAALIYRLIQRKKSCVSRLLSSIFHSLSPPSLFGQNDRLVNSSSIDYIAINGFRVKFYLHVTLIVRREALDYHPFSFYPAFARRILPFVGSRHFPSAEGSRGIINEKNEEMHRALSHCAARDPYFMPDPAAPSRAEPVDSHRTNEAINSQLCRAVSSPRTKTLSGQGDSRRKRNCA